MRVIRLNPEQPRAPRWEERTREAAERMEKEREGERVCSHGEGEKRFEGREANLREKQMPS